MKVNVQYDSKVKCFDKVTKIENLLAFDAFENQIKIWQGKKVTIIKEYEIYGYEVLKADAD